MPNRTPAPVLVIGIDEDAMAPAAFGSETASSMGATSTNASKPWEIENDSEPNEYPWQVSADDNGDNKGTDVSYPYWQVAEVSDMNSPKGCPKSSITLLLGVIFSCANWMLS
ncbi:hypothetical protein ACHAXA_003129 [Cyclostephanos tholiformis]